uniref:Uncharacterized protein n=1 Tax=Gracilaria gracilis TaxID=2777 RepID=A0A345UBA2_GRAGA|nr:hypothetical protein [Gracilaria gracilis]AXI97738.1 hypothetical protein [Gracilaria gracilis]
MNQFRLSSQCNFIEVFDSLDSSFLDNKRFLLANTLDCFQISSKFENLSKLIFIPHLFLECIATQKFFFLPERKQRSSLFLITTIRRLRVFLFLEMLLYSVFSIQQDTINSHKIKIASLDLFWPNIILDKFLIPTLIQKNFMICVK